MRRLPVVTIVLLSLANLLRQPQAERMEENLMAVEKTRWERSMTTPASLSSAMSLPLAASQDRRVA
eukprot:1528257-Alexandrium_andersonii.AAC.1